MLKKNKNKTHKKNKETPIINSTQIFSPISDIKDGIIKTKDNRWIKILEFLPINFGLRSFTEQDAIISQFAAAIRVMPDTVQFKVISKRAEISDFVEIIEREMKQERNEGCRKLQQEQINLIETVSSRQGVSRRFLVIFSYAESTKLQHSPQFDEIKNSLETDALTIINALKQCGNEVVKHEDENEFVFSILYELMCRSEAEVQTYNTKSFETLTRYAFAKNIDHTKKLTIPVNDFISPGIIDTQSSPKYIIVDDLYYMFCYIPSMAYPTTAYAGWLSILINLGEGIDVDFWFHKENIATTQRKLQYKLRYNKVKAKDTEDTSQDYDDLMDAIRAGYYLKSGISSNDDFCYMGTMITITAYSYKELMYKYDAIKRHCIRNDIKLKPCLFQQLEAFRSSLPICKYNDGIWRKSRRNILSSALASAYPFVSYELADEDGILLGANSNNGSLVFVNVFDTQKYTNANVAILGSSGAGKTYTLQCMALRMREKQIQTFIIAPLKGIEFERACKAVGGTFVRISPASGNNINIMEIRKKAESIDSIIEYENGAEESILAAKIQQLHTFFSLLVPEITFDERQILDDAFVETYGNFGITTENKSLIDPNNPDQYKAMPILGDLYDVLEKKHLKNGKRLYSALKRYVKGSAQSFNKPTNVNLENKYIVLDVSTLTKETLPLGMFIALDYVWDKAREDRTQKKVIYIDETWRLIGPGSSALAAEFVLEIFKTIRGFGGSAIAATQDLNDFFALNNGEFGTGIINNSKTKILMKTEAKEADTVAKVMDLTRNEVEQIKRIQRGTCLLAANTNHVFVDIKASPTEHRLITTDAQDLRKMALEE